jgi:hypothetical protein
MRWEEELVEAGTDSEQENRSIRDEAARLGIRIVDVRFESFVMVAAGPGPASAPGVKVPK